MKAALDHMPLQNPRALRREITGILCLKAAGLVLLYWLFFAPSTHPLITTPSLSTHLLTADPQ